MHRATLAELVLSRVTSRSRATAIVGDLLEVDGQRNSLRFWYSLAGVALSFIWLRLLVFVAALFGGQWLFGLLVTASDSTQARHLPPSSLEPAFGFLIFFGSTSWTAVVYLMSHYSPKDRTA